MLVAEGLVDAISPETVRRILRHHKLKPWRHHLWLSAKTPRDAAFARQVQALGRPGNVLLGISTSGNSTNIIRAVTAARDAGMRTVALSGQGGRLREMADVAIAVPSTNTQYIQEAHLLIEHVLCDLVERILFGARENT